MRFSTDNLDGSEGDSLTFGFDFGAPKKQTRGAMLAQKSPTSNPTTITPSAAASNVKSSSSSLDLDSFDFGFGANKQAKLNANAPVAKHNQSDDWGFGGDDDDANEGFNPPSSKTAGTQSGGGASAPPKPSVSTSPKPFFDDDLEIEEIGDLGSSTKPGNKVETGKVTRFHNP
jgi:hypothetical protein